MTDDEDRAMDFQGQAKSTATASRPDYTAYTIKLPTDQLAALQSIWLELKRLYGANSPDKSGMIEAAVDSWLKRWDSEDRDQLLAELLEIRRNTRARQYKKPKS